MRSPELVEGATQTFPKGRIFDQIGYHVYAQEVADFHNSTARYRIVSAPNRASKSWAAGHDVLGDVFPPLIVHDGKVKPVREECLIWCVAPDYALCKEFQYLWSYLHDNRKRYGWMYQIERGSTNNPKQGNMKLAIRWGETPDGNVSRTIIEGKSATNEKGLQSEEVHVVIMSEAADQEERIYTQYLYPRSGKMLIPTTPKIKAEWVRQLIEDGSQPGMDTEVFEFPPWANPKYDWGRFKLAALKAESRVAKPKVYDWGWPGATREKAQADPDRAVQPGQYIRLDDGLEVFHRTIRGASCAEEDPIFGETFLGMWTYESERVLPFKWVPDHNGTCHVVNDHDLPDWVHRARMFVSTDYGYSDPASAGFWAVSPEGTKVRLDEIYETHLGAEDFVRKIKRKMEDNGWNRRVGYYLGDPQKPEVSSYMQRLGLPVWGGQSAWLRDRASGHAKLVDDLSVDPGIGKPRLFVHERCKDTISEWKLLRRKSKASQEFATGGFIGADHAYDDSRYFCRSNPHGRREQTTADEQEQLRQWSLRMRSRNLIESPRELVGVGMMG